MEVLQFGELFVKHLLLALASISVVLIGSNVYSQTEQTFILTDGYFQVEGGQPAHLTHDNVQLNVALGDKYRFWTSFKVRFATDGNPCSRSKELPCVILVKIVQKDERGKEKFLSGWMSRLEFRTDESISVNSFERNVAHYLPKGRAHFIICILRDGQYLMRREWPMDIR